MRWQGQKLGETDAAALPGLEDRSSMLRSVTTPEFAGMTFHEVLSKSALNHVPGASRMPFAWTINPYRGCSHACRYCFARGTHEYLDLDGGADFDSQIVVKTNVVEVLQRELRKGSWQHETVALGTNTDPYQRAEGRYKLMPGIIEALAASGTPISILTKGTLIRRDIPLLVKAAQRVPVDVQMSIAMYDDDLQKAIEPGTPSTQARLDTVKALTDAGFPVTVFLMPIMPHMTDSVEAIDTGLRRIKDAGARRVIYGALHLRPGVKPWFMKWLGEARPDLVSSYLGLYPGVSAEAPKGYRQWLAKRARPLIRMHGLDGRDEDDYPRRGNRPPQGHVDSIWRQDGTRSTARSSTSVGFRATGRAAETAAQPRLF